MKKVFLVNVTFGPSVKTFSGNFDFPSNVFKSSTGLYTLPSISYKFLGNFDFSPKTRKTPLLKLCFLGLESKKYLPLETYPQLLHLDFLSKFYLDHLFPFWIWAVNNYKK